MNKVLVIDDDQPVLNYLRIFLLQTDEYEVTTLANSRKAYEEIQNNNYDLILLDMDMPDVTGIDILKYIQENEVDVETIVLTGVEDLELAVSAMKVGAYDYLTKPVDNERLLRIMKNALDRKKSRDGDYLIQEAETLKDLKFKEAFSNIVTQSKKMIKIFQTIEKIARSDSSVLIWGESGTGKELIAKAIHEISKRNKENFIAVNAGVFANELFASEFFGHIKGAFSGADANKKGFIEEANKGTLFLDE